MFKKKIHVLLDGHLIVVGEAGIDGRGVIRDISIKSLPTAGPINLIIETKNSTHGPCMVNIGSIEINRQPNPFGIENQLQLAV